MISNMQKQPDVKENILPPGCKNGNRWRYPTCTTTNINPRKCVRRRTTKRSERNERPDMLYTLVVSMNENTPLLMYFHPVRLRWLPLLWCTVRATVLDFPDYDRCSVRFHGRPVDVLTDAVCLQLVSALRVSPDFNLLLFNPDAKMNLSIIGGSSFLDAAVNDSKVVEVIALVPEFQCLQLMITPKGLGTALVTVYDIGLSPPLSASAVSGTMSGFLWVWTQLVEPWFGPVDFSRHKNEYGTTIGWLRQA
ncbi:hypothetical protein Dimus_013680 [Dionaea muscipula]